MTEVETIFGYFPLMDERQRDVFRRMKDVYAEWNARINVVSRKDFDSFYLHHVLHSLAIARFCSFDAGAEVLDVGCGGGFPSVPLAVAFPGVRFTAVDSIGKKVRVVEEVCRELGIGNVEPLNCRVETLGRRFDYIVSRAVTDMPSFLRLTKGLCRHGEKGSIRSGIIYLKGGDLTEELRQTGLEWRRQPISEYFQEEYFATKEIVYTAI